MATRFPIFENRFVSGPKVLLREGAKQGLPKGGTEYQDLIQGSRGFHPKSEVKHALQITCIIFKNLYSATRKAIYIAYMYFFLDTS